MELRTTEPGVQFYTTYYLKGTEGKGENVYGQFSALCLESQHYPDSIHHVSDLELNHFYSYCLLENKAQFTLNVRKYMTCHI